MIEELYLRCTINNEFGLKETVKLIGGRVINGIPVAIIFGKNVHI